jgi:hypothetical protein
MKSRGRTSRRSDRLGIDSHLGRIHEKRHSMKSRGRTSRPIPTNSCLMMNLQINEGTIWYWRRRLEKVNLESMAWKQR